MLQLREQIRNTAINIHNQQALSNLDDLKEHTELMPAEAEDCLENWNGELHSGLSEKILLRDRDTFIHRI